MAPVIKALSARQGDASVRVCVTGQHREMLDQVLDLFGIEADTDLNLMQPNQTLAELTANAVKQLSDVIDSEAPDWVLVQGDTTTVMAASLAAFYERVPVGHIEAGLRTQDPYSPFPEEINRRLTSVIARAHFAPTRRAAQNLQRESVPACDIFLTGNTIVDAVLGILRNPPSLAAKVLFERLGIDDHDATNELGNPRILLVTAHRRESFGQPFESICRGIRRIADNNPQIKIIYPVHLNPNVRDPVNRLLSDHAQIHLLEPLAYEPFLRVMQRAHFVLTDSGGIQEEASVLGKPVLVLRDVTERMEIIDAGIGRLVGTDEHAIAEESQRLLNQSATHSEMRRSEELYGDGHAAERIADILLSCGCGQRRMK